jgi:ribonuclease HI
MPQWINNGWRTYSGQQIRNEKEFRLLLRNSNGIDVYYEKVPAHAGIYGNVQADRLATMAINY